MAAERECFYKKMRSIRGLIKEERVEVDGGETWSDACQRCLSWSFGRLSLSMPHRLRRRAVDYQHNNGLSISISRKK